MSLYSLGHILVEEGKPGEASRLLDRLILVNPKYAPGFQMRAVALERVGRYEEAIDSMDKGLAIDPNDVDALIRRGVLLDRLGRVNEAILSLRRALLISPADEMALANLGKALYFSKRYKDAGAAFQLLVGINPGYQYALGLLAFNRLHEGNWSGFEDTVTQINEGIRSGRPSCMSLAFISMSDSADDQLKCARLFTKLFHPIKSNPLWNGELYRHERIRIAYISPDFREHPVGHLLAGVIERHDKSRFEIIGLSLGLDDQSVLRGRFAASFERFLDVWPMALSELSNLIRSLEVDIAVDLSGFTTDNRTDLFANRVAPVQVNYLGYPGTMGASYMDYIIADKYVIPEALTNCYDEKVVYLPDTYLPTNSTQSASSYTPTREEVGLPASGFVFCSFNHIFKINPNIFHVWMQLLAAVQDSVLWLSKPSDEAAENLRQAATLAGIDPKRLVFAGRVPLVEDHLARYRLADLFLDTTPYNAHTTAADALMVGLPVLTCSGNSFASRVAGSLLHAIGLPELITESLDQYRELALELARAPERLADLKARLAANRSRHALFDTGRYCSHLEAAFTKMHTLAQNDQPATSFGVERIAIG
jgi:predicted O-linked N-acetylglucosamine transferase (SPINDLY family)